MVGIHSGQPDPREQRSRSTPSQREAPSTGGRPRVTSAQPHPRPSREAIMDSYSSLHLLDMAHQKLEWERALYTYTVQKVLRDA